MKKLYIQPASNEMNFHVEGMIATSPGSIGIGSGGQVSGEDEQLSNKKNPIWARDEESSESYW